ncbi:MAG: YiiD C-terminal domain-containing protein [Parvularculaceae bacterium]|nr:YiiD C-terminal domain-containing protein [Parvularculaceae bacterium]
MDIFAIIKAQMAKTVPFAAHTGVVIEEVAAGTSIATLDQTDHTSNHIGSQHAGALFTLGEAASGAAMAGGFSEVMMSIRPVAATAEIAYKKVAKGRITAHGRVEGDLATLRTDLDEHGKVQFPVTVTLKDDSDAEVAVMSVQWNVRDQNKRSQA